MKQSKRKKVDIIYLKILRWKPQSKIKTGKFILDICIKNHGMYPFKCVCVCVRKKKRQLKYPPGRNFEGKI